MFKQSASAYLKWSREQLKYSPAIMQKNPRDN